MADREKPLVDAHGAELRPALGGAGDQRLQADQGTAATHLRHAGDVASGRDLANRRQALGPGVVVEALQRGVEEHARAGGAGDVVDVVEAHADVLVEGVAAGDLVADQHQFVQFRESAGYRTAVGDAMAAVAVGREPDGAAVDRLAHQSRHLALLVDRRVLLDAAFAHHEVAQRPVSDHARDVDAGAEAFDGVQVAAVVHPVPGQARQDRLARDVLDGLHHAGEKLAVLGSAGREGDAAVADQRRRDAVAGDRGDVRIPADLRIEVRMQVDEAGRDGQALSVDFASALGAHLADGRYRTVVDGNVARYGLAAKAVDDMATPDHKFMRHSVPPLLGRL